MEFKEKTGQGGRIVEKSKWKSVAFGVGIGGANAVFGGGGGMLAVPALRLLGYGQKEAHATAILVILPVSFFSFLLYFIQGMYDFSVLIPTAIGVTAGGAVGALILGKLPTKTVTLVFAFLQAVAGAFLFFSK